MKLTSTPAMTLANLIENYQRAAAALSEYRMDKFPHGQRVRCPDGLGRVDGTRFASLPMVAVRLDSKPNEFLWQAIDKLTAIV